MTSCVSWKSRDSSFPTRFPRYIVPVRRYRWVFIQKKFRISSYIGTNERACSRLRLKVGGVPCSLCSLHILLPPQKQSSSCVEEGIASFKTTKTTETTTRRSSMISRCSAEMLLLIWHPKIHRDRCRNSYSSSADSDYYLFKLVLASRSLAEIRSALSLCRLALQNCPRMIPRKTL